METIKIQVTPNTHRYNSLMNFLNQDNYIYEVDKTIDKIKQYEKVKGICVNIKEKQDSSPTCLSSIPDGGSVTEFTDRYEWDVITHNGLNLMKVYKKDFVSIEMVI